VYEALAEAISERVATRPGDSAPSKNQIFLENGGAFYYEHLPHRPDGGLVEGATPECRSPAQVLLYQKAQERLLVEALPRARQLLWQRGHGGAGEPCNIGLLKNCRDAEGNVYGAQENYEVEIASGLSLALYRVGLVLLLPLILLQAVVSWLVQVLVALVLVFVTIVGLLAALMVPRLRSLQVLASLAEVDERTLNAVLGRFQLWLAYVLTWPMTTPFSLLLRVTAFRPQRRSILAFLVSRPVITGAGTVTPEGRFGLSEKGPAVRKVLRWSIRPEDRPIFDTGNLLKQVAAPMNLRFAPLFDLFRRRQRMQLGFSDSNCAQVAEYLKVATTALVLDMEEAGYLADAPRLRRPLTALGAFIEDPSLEAKAQVRGGEARTALEIQRFYLDRASAFVRASEAPSMEHQQVLRLWQEALDALAEGEQETLVGRLDWVTKRVFLEGCDQGGEGLASRDREAVLKTLDLRYHELGEGYLARLEGKGLAPRLVDEDQVEAATRNPPHDSPAFLRGTFIRRRARSLVPIRISWGSAWIGGRFQGRLVPFRSRSQGPKSF